MVAQAEEGNVNAVEDVTVKLVDEPKDTSSEIPNRPITSQAATHDNLLESDPPKQVAIDETSKQGNSKGYDVGTEQITSGENTTTYEEAVKAPSTVQGEEPTEEAALIEQTGTYAEAVKVDSTNETTNETDSKDIATPVVATAAAEAPAQNTTGTSDIPEEVKAISPFEDKEERLQESDVAPLQAEVLPGSKIVPESSNAHLEVTDTSSTPAQVTATPEHIHRDLASDTTPSKSSILTTTTTSTPSRPGPTPTKSRPTSVQFPIAHRPGMSNSRSQSQRSLDTDAISASTSAVPSRSNSGRDLQVPETPSSVNEDKQGKTRKRLSSIKGFVRRISDQGGLSRSQSTGKSGSRSGGLDAEEEGEDKKKKRLSLNRGNSFKG